MRAYPEAYKNLLGRLTAFKVLHWGVSSTAPDTRDREQAPMADAHVVSSLRKEDGRHALVIDIDHPSWLVKSSTEGHYHLYVDVPHGIPWDQYKRLLVALSAAGVIEPGYASASIMRGHSDVRLPWIKKGQENG